MSQAAILTYTANPSQVAVSGATVPNIVSIAITATNATAASVQVAQIVLTVPQGAAATDLMAPGTSFTAGSVHSSDGTPWSIVADGNQSTLVPVTGAGYATIAPKTTLLFALSGLQVNSAGAGSSAQVAVQEFDQNSGVGAQDIAIAKIQAGFGIAAFYLSQYNVDAGAPVTVTWKVVGALSCEVDAAIIGVGMQADRAERQRCGVGTGSPACDGIIASGTDFAGSNTCNVQGATLFTLTARGTSGTGDATLSSQLLVTVNEPAINFTGYPPTTMQGQSVNVQWIAADAAKLQLYIAPAQGQPTIEDKTHSPVGSETETPLVDTTYYLYAFGNAGDAQPDKQAAFPVTVYPPAWTKLPAVSNQTHPTYPGDQFTLDWTVQNVQSCRLDSSVVVFQPLVGLPLNGPQPVTVPDPGVPLTNATFTLSPVMYGTQGDFSPQTFPITITNTPNITAGLAANPSGVAPGAQTVLTWTADHADAGTLTDNLPGSTWSQPVTPASGTQAVTVPDLILPTPITYTLTLTRQSGKYESTTANTVQCTGQVTTASCNGAAGSSYLDSLYLKFPDKPITQVGIAGNGEDGINAIFLWYSGNAAADYVIRASWGWSSAPDTTMVIAAGDCLSSFNARFGSIKGNWNPWGLAYLSLTTAQGRSISAGFTPGDHQDHTISAASGQQIIALTWQLGVVTDDDGKGEALGDLGAVSCTTAYGN